MDVGGGRGLRLPRAERRRQDDRGQAAPRACPAERWARDRARCAARRPVRAAPDRLPAGAVPVPAVAAGARGAPAPRTAHRRRGGPVGGGPGSVSCDEVGLLERADDAVGGFSKGMQQRLGLGGRAARRPGARDPRRADLGAGSGRPGGRPLDHPPGTGGRGDASSSTRTSSPRSSGSATGSRSSTTGASSRAAGSTTCSASPRSGSTRPTCRRPPGPGSSRFGRVAVTDDGWLTITGLDAGRDPGRRRHDRRRRRPRPRRRPGPGDARGSLSRADRQPGRGRDGVMATLTIAGLTVAEVVRRRIAWVLIALTVVSVLLTTLGRRSGWSRSPASAATRRSSRSGSRRRRS